MFEPKLCIEFTIHPFDKPIVVCRNIPTRMLYEAFRKIDVPSVIAGPGAFLCDTPVVIEKVKLDRKLAAESISKEITSMIIDLMASNDTEMGYKR